MQISLLFTILHCYRRKKLKNEKNSGKTNLGGHLRFLKKHRGDFWGLNGFDLGRYQGNFPENFSCVHFFSG